MSNIYYSCTGMEMCGRKVDNNATKHKYRLIGLRMWEQGLENRSVKR